MAKATSTIHLRLAPRQVRPFSITKDATLGDLAMLGCQFPEGDVRDLMHEARHAGYVDGSGMDAAGPGLITPASINTPVQFLQHWMPGTIQVVTAARNIDDIAGRSIAGNWADEEIVQTVIERTGQARPYQDDTSFPLSSFNTSFERRTIVRFEDGMEVGKLEEERTAAMRINSAEEKRAASGNSLAIELNRIGFFGYNAGANRTYGLLNDPNLPAYKTVPVGAGGSTMFKDKTYREITGDIRMAVTQLRVQSKGLVNPSKVPLTLTLPTSCMEYLSVENEFGKPVSQWIKETYPTMTVKDAPELDGANGGVNVMYLHAEHVPGPGKEGQQKVLDHFVPAAFRLLGVERVAKGFRELFSNATAGVMWRVPIGVVRYCGI